MYLAVLKPGALTEELGLFAFTTFFFVTYVILSTIKEVIRINSYLVLAPVQLLRLPLNA